MLTCAECHVPLNLTEDQERRLRKSHASFFCVNGHSQYFPAKTDEDVLREENRKLQTSIERWQNYARELEQSIRRERRRYIGLQGANAKLRKQVEALKGAQ